MCKAKQTRLDFLLESIQDTQQWIRFLDTKAGALALFITTIFLWLTESVIQKIGFVIEYFCTLKYGVLLNIGILIFLVGLPTTILFIVFFILSPRINPSKHVKKNDNDILGIFFLSTLDKKRNLDISLSEYNSILNNADQESILSELAHELLKLSYIRTIKEKLMKVATWLVFTYIILSLAGYILMFLFCN